MPEGFPSYPKVYNLGHRALDGLFDAPVIVQEKIDGSQINFRWDESEQLHVRSKGTWQYGGPNHRVEPDGQFKPAVDHLLGISGGTPSGLIFRGETLAKPKHNTLAYERTPAGHIVLFDVVSDGWHRDPELSAWADDLGVDVVDERETIVTDLPGLENLVEATKPMLGGDHVEGLVFKRFDKFDTDGKPLMGKLVRAEFREKHEKEWKGEKKGPREVVQTLIGSLNTEARFEKAVQHLRDDGLIEDDPRDIGRLMVEVKRDVLAEETDWIKDQLWAAFRKDIERGVGRGLPEWYKARLAERQFS